MISNAAQMISQTLNPFTGHYMMAPGLVQLETEVIHWFINLMGFPESEAGGFLTTGSSLATLSALAMARNKIHSSQDYSALTLYVSDQAHHCVSKAWVTLGFDPAKIRFIPTTRPDFRLDVSALREALQADRRAGLKPLAVVASAGTTNTGAVDSLSEVAAIAREEKIWFHVDGAYGALFRLTEKAQDLLRGIELADSVVFDLHKALALSYGTGCLLVRDRKDMRFDYRGGKSYMPPEIEETEARVDFADISPELSRDYRGLRVWLPLKTWGIGPFALNLEEKIRLAEWLAQELKRLPQVEVVAEPQLSILAFTLKTGVSREENNLLTQKLLEKINRRGTLFLSACELDGKKCIRFCLLGFRLHYERLHQALAEIRDDLRDLTGVS